MYVKKVYTKKYESLSIGQRLDKRVQSYWQEKNITEQALRDHGRKSFTFYEGPPSANGVPGIHHLMARTVKDIFCRYKTQQGYYVQRRAGWDTHGLPIELQVEKELNITKEDIGQKISIADYNQACQAAVLKYTHQWEKFTQDIGFWIDFTKAYRTCDPSYIESVWSLVARLYAQDLLYQGYSIQPYSPAAGTALSQHELNQPGCYREVSDRSAVVQFKIKGEENKYFLAWTTTPWTLPANSALAVGKEILYVAVETLQPYTQQLIVVWIAEDCLSQYFQTTQEAAPSRPAWGGEKAPLSRIVERKKGKELLGTTYEPLMSYITLPSSAFQVYAGDFVSTKEGTGIVHIAPTFGADDYKLAQTENIPSVLTKNEKGEPQPIVDTQGRFVREIKDFAGKYVKDFGRQKEYTSTDQLILQKLKAEGHVFVSHIYRHNYPHCWRTDQPIIYYPIHAWFVRLSACREQLVRLNKTIHWQPASTGTGRFGNWLSQLEDWNISRSRFWGTPIPIWTTEDGEERRCVGSFEELRKEVQRAIKEGLMSQTLAEQSIYREDFDPHRPFVDDIVLCSSQGLPMHRVPEVLDVWFDSGAMPYAQWHYPFEHKDIFEKQFPADFISEGVDQTRGWFFTLHALAGILQKSVAYKHVLSTGLVLDKKGRKMSKRLGNSVEPNDMLKRFGADVLRWYMVSAANPWENLRFDVEGVAALRRGFFGTLENVFNFFMLYAKIDALTISKDVRERIETLFDMTRLQEDTESDSKTKKNPSHLLPERYPSQDLDTWLWIRLQQIEKNVQRAYESYEPRQAAQIIERFVVDDVSNWYVRLNRKRFWRTGSRSEVSQNVQVADKYLAYDLLYVALHSLSQLIAPIAPSSAEYIFLGLEALTEDSASSSVHLTSFPTPLESNYHHTYIEQAMCYAQRASSLIHSIRKRNTMKVRQPLKEAYVVIDHIDERTSRQIEKLLPYVEREVNVKKVSLADASILKVRKSLRPVLSRLGRRLGAAIKEFKQVLETLSQEEIQHIEKEKRFSIMLKNERIEGTLEDLLIDSEAVEGWEHAKEEGMIVTLSTEVTPELEAEGMARELINKLQHLRKEKGLDVVDKVELYIEGPTELHTRILSPDTYLHDILHEIQATQPQTSSQLSHKDEIIITNYANKKYKLYVSMNKIRKN